MVEIKVALIIVVLKGLRYNSRVDAFFEEDSVVGWLRFYFEWIICVGTFLIVAILDKVPIKTPALMQEKETESIGSQVYES